MKVKPMPVTVLSVVSSVLSLYWPELTPSVLVAALREYPRRPERDPKACRGVSMREFGRMWSMLVPGPPWAADGTQISAAEPCREAPVEYLGHTGDVSLQTPPRVRTPVWVQRRWGDAMASRLPPARGGTRVLAELRRRVGILEDENRALRARLAAGEGHAQVHEVEGPSLVGAGTSGANPAADQPAAPADREPERHLSQARGLLEAVTLGTRVLIASVDRGFRYTYFNPEHHREMKRLTGRDTAVGMGLMDVLQGMPAERDRALAIWRRALDGETTVQRLAFGDIGRYRRWYEARHAPVRDATGAVVGAGEVTIDITELVQAEGALCEREEQLRHAIDGAPIPVILIAEDGQVLRTSRAWAEITGYSPAETPAFGVWLDRACRESAATVQEHLRALFGGAPGSQSLELDVRTRTGQRRRWSFSASAPAALDDGRRFVIGMALDVTERAQAEEAAQGSRRLLETVVNHMPAAVTLICGADLRIQLANPAYRAIAPGKEMVGRTLDEIWPETGQGFAAICRRVLDTGVPHHVVDELNTVCRAPGTPPEPAYFSWSLHRVRLPGEEGWGLVNAAWETTARKAAEEAVRSIALFPEQNPEPVMRVSAEGRLLYANPGAAWVLRSWHRSVGDVLPDPPLRAAVAALSSGAPSEIEIHVGVRTLSFRLMPIRDRQYVNLYPADRGQERGREGTRPLAVL